MDGKEFFMVAENLMEGTKEAEYRSAVSRAYYGAFLCGRQLLTDWGFTVEKESKAHGEVRQKFRACEQAGIIDVAKAASNLYDLHSARLDADYLKTKKIGEREVARRWVEIARSIIAQLEGCKNEPKKTRVIEAIKDYEAKIQAASAPPKP